MESLLKQFGNDEISKSVCISALINMLRTGKSEQECRGMLEMMFSLHLITFEDIYNYVFEHIDNDRDVLRYIIEIPRRRFDEDNESLLSIVRHLIRLACKFKNIMALLLILQIYGKLSQTVVDLMFDIACKHDIVPVVEAILKNISTKYLTDCYRIICEFNSIGVFKYILANYPDSINLQYCFERLLQQYGAASLDMIVAVFDAVRVRGTIINVYSCGYNKILPKLFDRNPDIARYIIDNSDLTNIYTEIRRYRLRFIDTLMSVDDLFPEIYEEMLMHIDEKTLYRILRILIPMLCICGEGMPQRFQYIRGMLMEFPRLLTDFGEKLYTINSDTGEIEEQHIIIFAVVSGNYRFFMEIMEIYGDSGIEYIDANIEMAFNMAVFKKSYNIANWIMRRQIFIDKFAGFNSLNDIFEYICRNNCYDIFVRLYDVVIRESADTANIVRRYNLLPLSINTGVNIDLMKFIYNIGLWTGHDVTNTFHIACYNNYIDIVKWLFNECPQYCEFPPDSLLCALYKHHKTDIIEFIASNYVAEMQTIMPKPEIFRSKNFGKAIEFMLYLDKWPDKATRLRINAIITMNNNICERVRLAMDTTHAEDLRERIDFVVKNYNGFCDLLIKSAAI